jgi:hypothetical protein
MTCCANTVPSRSSKTGSSLAVRVGKLPPVVHSSLYLPEPVYEALRRIAFDERVKIHDLAITPCSSVVAFPPLMALEPGRNDEAVRGSPRPAVALLAVGTRVKFLNRFSRARARPYAQESPRANCSF